MSSADPRPPGRRRVVIESLGVYVPPQTLSTDQVVAGCVAPIRIPLERLTGIRRRAVADGEFGLDLATAALADCLAGSRHAPGTFDLLISAAICAQDQRHHVCFEPGNAVRLKAACGASRAVTFDLSNGCAGVWTAILLAEAMIASGEAERALVVSGEAITGVLRTAQLEIVDYLDPQMSSLTVGDGAIALTLEAGPDGPAGFDFLDLYTLGAFADYCVSEPTARPHGSYLMRTDALRLGARSVEHAGAHLAWSLRMAGWSPRQIAHLVPHQTSETTLRDGLRRVNEQVGDGGFTAAQYHVNLAERGNTATTSHFLALADAGAAGRLHAGERAAFSITGSGLSIGTALYTFDDLPARLAARAARPAAPAAALPAQVLPLRAHPGLRRPVTLVAATGVVRGRDADGLDSLALSVQAGRAGLLAGGVAADEVTLVVHAGVYRSGFVVEPALAACAAGAMGMNAAAPAGAARHTLAFNLMSGHLGVLKACSIVNHWLRAGRPGPALVLTSDVENHAAAPERGLYGLEPSGGACLLTRADGHAGFEAFHFRDVPEHGALFNVGVRNPGGPTRLDVHRNAAWDAVAARELAQTVRDLLDAVDLDLDAFAAVVTPSGWPGLRAGLRAHLGLPNRCLMAPADGAGELVGAWLAAGLDALGRDGRVPPGGRVLVAAAGGGLQTGVAILRM